MRAAQAPASRSLCLNALSGIGGVQTGIHTPPERLPAGVVGLNALSGIGGVQTDLEDLRQDACVFAS